MYNGQGCNLSKLTVCSSAKSYSISAENPTGAKGMGGMATEGTGAEAARDLGRGWKVSPSIFLSPKESVELASIDGEGIIRHIWMTLDAKLWRSVLLKMYWDGSDTPAVCTPIGDFFCSGWCTSTHINSLAVTVNPRGGFNSYFEMPFFKHARIVVENLSADRVHLFYQIDYALTKLDPDSLYFHASFNRTSPLTYGEDYTILETIKGRGHFVGAYMAWQPNNNGWWGEGEIKFFMDGDKEYPTICGTGTEDYFGGAWCFLENGEYVPYSTAYQGFLIASKPAPGCLAGQRFSMYRWHITDPITFEKDLRVTVQALG